MDRIRNRPVLIAGALLLLIALAAVGWYLGSPLFINNAVDESFPFEMPDQATLDGMSPAEMADLQAEFMAAMPEEGELAGLSDADREAVAEEVMKAAAMLPGDQADEPMPAEADPVILAEGTFRDADDFHQGEGSATIYELPDGSRVLRFEGFSVTNGPDLHVLLSSQPNPSNREEVMAGYLDLGKLKGNQGNQNYEIPPGTDLSVYQGVVIYCQPFHVVFATAALAN